METKEDLVNSIKEWLKLESEITKFQVEIRERKRKIKLLTETLVGAMKKNEIDCFNINGGALIYKQTKSKKAINSKSLLVSLQDYFKNDLKTAEELTKHILENRGEQIKETLKRKIDKK